MTRKFVYYLFLCSPPVQRAVTPTCMVAWDYR